MIPCWKGIREDTDRGDTLSNENGREVWIDNIRHSRPFQLNKSLNNMSHKYKKKCPKCGAKVKYFSYLFIGDGEKCSKDSKHYKVFYPDDPIGSFGLF